jgi:hypothetical protein
LLEEETVFGHFYRLGFGADHFNFVFVENAALGKVNSDIQRRLATHSREKGIRPFPLDDGRHEFRCERLNVRTVGQFRICHDGRRIRVDQNDLVAFLAQRLASLCAGVVEFARLADNDRTGADDQNFVDIRTLRH